MTNSRDRNIKLIKLIGVLIDFKLFPVIQALFFVKVTGSYTLGMSIFVISFITNTTTTIFAGSICDYIGRKKTFIIAMILLIIEMLLWLASSYYLSYLIYISALIGGLGQAFLSETDTAFLYENSVDDNEGIIYQKNYSNYRSIKLFSAGISGVLGGITASLISYEASIIISLVPMLMILFLLFFLVEPRNQINQVNKHAFAKDIIKKTISSFCFFKSNKKLCYVGLGQAVSSVFSSVLIDFNTIFFATLIPVWLMGIARSFRMFVDGVGFWFSPKIIRKTSLKTRIFTGRNIFVFINIGGVLFNNIVTPFVYGLSVFWIGVETTTSSLLINKIVHKDSRVTQLSILEFIKMLLLSVMTLLSGFLADIYSPFIAASILAVCSLIPSIFFREYLKVEN